MIVNSTLFPQISVLDESLSLFFIQLVIILAVCRTLSAVGQYFHQPSVVFEIVGGILLGPSALGKYEPYRQALLPVYSLDTLTIIANFGLQLYLFLVGLELDLGILKEHSTVTAAIALSGIAIPFGIGLAISLLLYDLYLPETLDGQRQSFTTFAVFIGTAMAVTALPVLARILKEQNMMYTKPGFVTLGAAVITDAVAWVLLVVAISLANSANIAIAGWTFLGITSYAVVVFTLGRWVLQLVVQKVEDWSTSAAVLNNLLSAAIILLFLSASLVAQLGIDPIVGSFLFGVVVPRRTHLHHCCVHTLENFVLVLLLPLFFAVSGLRTDVTALQPYPDLLILLLVCVGATVGKLAGAGVAAFACGMSVRESAVVAVLMNTRGLVELIVLNIGQQFHVLDNRAFSILVLMCLFTTFLTCPLIQCIYPTRLRKFVNTPRSISTEGTVDRDVEVGVRDDCDSDGADHLHSHSEGSAWGDSQPSSQRSAGVPKREPSMCEEEAKLGGFDTTEPAYPYEIELTSIEDEAKLGGFDTAEPARARLAVVGGSGGGGEVVGEVSDGTRVGAGAGTGNGGVRPEVEEVHGLKESESGGAW